MAATPKPEAVDTRVIQSKGKYDIDASLAEYSCYPDDFVPHAADIL